MSQYLFPVTSLTSRNALGPDGPEFPASWAPSPFPPQPPIHSLALESLSPLFLGHPWKSSRAQLSRLWLFPESPLLSWSSWFPLLCPPEAPFKLVPVPFVLLQPPSTPRLLRPPRSAAKPSCLIPVPLQPREQVLPVDARRWSEGAKVQLWAGSSFCSRHRPAGRTGTHT